MSATNPGIGVLWMWMSKLKSLVAPSSYWNYVRFLAKPKPVSLLLWIAAKCPDLTGCEVCSVRQHLFESTQPCLRSEWRTVCFKIFSKVWIRKRNIHFLSGFPFLFSWGQVLQAHIQQLSSATKCLYVYSLCFIFRHFSWKTPRDLHQSSSPTAILGVCRGSDSKRGGCSHDAD